MRYFIVVFLMLNSIVTVGQQSIKKYPLPKNKSEIRSLMSKAYDLTLSLPKNYVTDGTVDYTSYLQKGINRNAFVKMPNFPVLVNSSGIKLNSGNSLFFQPSSQIKLKPNALVGYSVILISNISNANIYNAKIVGDRYKHLGEKGEWGMGIRIIDSKNINIYDANISECWGDGIYLGDDLSNKIINENINIFNALINRNRRNGITITSGKNIYILDTKITNSDGTMPMSGLDIEPNNKENRLVNINIKNLITENKGAGLIFSPSQLKGSNDYVSIYIDNHKDHNGRIGYHVGRLENEGGRLRGEIINNNPTYMNSGTNGILIESYSAEGSPKLIINNPKIINANVSNQKSPRWGSGIVFSRDSRRKANYKMGNLVIRNAEISDNRSNPKMQSGVHFVDDNNGNFTNTSIIGNIKTIGLPNDKIINAKVPGVKIIK